MRLALDALSVDLDGHRIVDALSLEAATGEVVGLVGPNGSGKSTALRCVYRALEPSAGVVRVGGDDLAGLARRVSAQRVAAVTQDAASDLDFTVAELVALGRAPHKRGNAPLDDRERTLCRRALADLDLEAVADRGVLGLSGGERQRALIARALVQEPRVLVLDEPTNHLDVRHQLALLGRLRRLPATVLVVLHDLNLAAAACDRLGVLHDGRLVACGAPSAVLTPALLRDVFGVDAEVAERPGGRIQLVFDLDTDRRTLP